MILKEVFLEREVVCRCALSSDEYALLIQSFEGALHGAETITLKNGQSFSGEAVQRYYDILKNCKAGDDSERMIEWPREAFVVAQGIIIDVMRGFCCSYDEHSNDLEIEFDRYLQVQTGLSFVLEEICDRVLQECEAFVG
jgi:hypothetical protein